MSRARRLAAALASASLAPAVLGVGGCVSLLPKQAPAQLYRFDARAAPAPAPAVDDGSRAPVVAPPVTVAAAVAGDRMLAVTGSEAAYIGGARWVSPAAVLWDEAVRRAFASRSARVRLLTRNELAGGGAFLRIEVPQFEVSYAASGAVPTVRVTVHALLAHRNGAFSAERTFAADAPAAADRVSAIVDAYDGAVEQVTAGLIAWADAHAGEAVAEAAATSGTNPDNAAASHPATRSTSTTTTTSSTRAPAGPPRR